MIDSYVLVKKALNSIHAHSFKNRDEIKKSLVCHCFQCKGVFASGAVTSWSDGDRTAKCPECGIGAVIGDASGYVMTDPLIDAMHTFWFESKFLGRDFDFDVLAEQ